jgi:hypothetical protein
MGFHRAVVGRVYGKILSKYERYLENKNIGS